MLQRDLVLKTRVMPRVSFVERRTDDREGAAALEHGGFVSRRVDPRCEAREDHETAAHELAGNPRRERPAFVRRAARAHDRDAGVVEEARVARGVESAPSRERHG